MNDSNDITLNLIEQYTAMFNKESEAITDGWIENDYKFKSDDTPDMRQFSGDEELKSSVKQEIIDKKAFDKYLADTTKIENEINEIRLANSREYAKELGRIAIDDGNLRKNLEKELFSQQLDNAKSIYSLQTIQDDDRYNELLQQEIELYNQTKVLNPDGSTNDLDINRLKEIQQEISKIERDHIREQRLLNDENYDELSLLEDQLGEKKLGYQREIRKYLSQNGVLQHEAEKKFQQGKINDLKNAYKLSRIQDNDRYDELLQHEAEIYETALKNNAELTKEELKTLKKIQQERSKIEQEFDDNNEERGSKSLKRLGGIKGVLKKLTDEVFSFINRDIDRFYTDNIKGAISEYNNFYETNFTEIAGRTGLGNREETHEIIRSTALTVSADETLKKGLNINKDVFPELANAVKQGFTGEDATAVAISNAVDKKIMPWLDTSSETWSYMQFTMSEDSLKAVKGQQLQLQATKEGNRLLQTGVISTLMDKFAPLLSSININTTSKDDLGDFYKIAESQLGSGATEKQIKEYASSLFDAVYKPYETLTTGGVYERTLAHNYLQTGDVASAVTTTGDTFENMLSGLNPNDRVGYDVARVELGLGAMGMETGTKTSFDQINITNKELSKMNNNQLTEVQMRNLYNEASGKLDEYVTATQEHDNQVQNETVEQIINTPLMAHGMDRLEDIVGKLNELKTWLIANVGAELVGGLLDKGWDKLTNKLGQKFFGKGGGTPSTGGASKTGLASKLLTGGQGFSTAANYGSNLVGMDSATSTLGMGLKGGGLVGGLAQGGAAMTGGAASGGAAVGVGAGTLAAGGYMMGKGIGIGVETAKNWDKSSNTDKAVGITTSAGAVAGGGMAAAAALGLASGPVGWIGLAVGGLALAGKAAYDYNEKMKNACTDVDILSGEFTKLKENVKQNTEAKQQEIETIREQFYLLGDENKQRQLLIETGIIPNADKTKLTTEMLEKYIEKMDIVVSDSGEKQEEVLGGLEAKYSAQSKDEIKGVIDQIYGHLKGKSEGEQRKLLKQLGFSEEEINAGMKNVKNGAMSDGELWKFLTVNDTKMKGVEIGSLEEKLESGEISESALNRYMAKNTNSASRITTKEQWMSGLGEIVEAVDYLSRYKKYGNPDNPVPAEGADAVGFNQETYDSYKNYLLGLGANNKEKVSDVWTEYGLDVNDLSDFPNSIKGYKLGSTYIPEDMTAQLHKGERVLTADQNKIYTEESIGGNKSIDIIKLSAKDIIKSIENQTQEIVNAIFAITRSSNSIDGTSLTVLPNVGNTRFV